MVRGSGTGRPPARCNILVIDMYSDEQIQHFINQAVELYSDHVVPRFEMVNLADLPDLSINPNPEKLAKRRAEWDMSKLTPLKLRMAIDGQHRLTIARELGLKQLPFLIWPGVEF